MINFDDPKWPPVARRHGFDWLTMTDRDRADFIAVVEYNRERRAILDADPEIIAMTARISESSDVSSMLMQRLQDMRDAACAHIKSAAEREMEIIRALNIPVDPPRLQHDPNTGHYHVMYCDTSHLSLTAKQAQSQEGRDQIKQKLAELETQHNDNTNHQKP